MQLAPSASGQPLGKTSYCPRMYAYDINARNGLCTATIKVADINAILLSVDNMAGSAICPVSTGACVSSVTGGVVKGFDMYGQHVTETVGAAGTSAIAFASVYSAPADALWANEYGLPYKRLSGTTTGITYTASAADGDSRGTFVVDAGITEPTEVTLQYTADQSNLLGDPYADRYASDPFHTEDHSGAPIAGTVDNTGEVVVTVPNYSSANTGVTIVFPDGHVERADQGDVVTYTLSPVWMSKYRKVVTATALDKLVSVSFDDTGIDNVYVDLTGSLV